MTPDELKEQLREERKKNGRQRNIDIATSSSDTDRTIEGHVGSSSSTSEPTDTGENGPGNSSGGSLQHALSAIRGRADNDQGHNSTATDIEGKLAGSFRSTTQVNRRVRSDNRRSSEDSSTYQSNGSDIRTGASLGTAVNNTTSDAPIIYGNLERNVENEPTQFIPPRTFTPEPSTQSSQPIIGEPALLFRDGKLTKREPKGVKKDVTRAVETVKAVIPKAKRGRPAGKSSPQNVLDGPGPSSENIFLKAAKQAGQAIPSSNKLTKKEIEELREPLTEALKDEFTMLDQLLWRYEGETSLQQPIWSDVMDGEMDRLVNALLNLGTRSSTVATIARTSVDMSDYIVAGTLLAPRLQATAALIGETRKRKRAMKPNTTRGAFNRK